MKKIVISVSLITILMLVAIIGLRTGNLDPLEASTLAHSKMSGSIEVYTDSLKAAIKTVYGKQVKTNVTRNGLAVTYNPRRKILLHRHHNIYGIPEDTILEGCDVRYSDKGNKVKVLIPNGRRGGTVIAPLSMLRDLSSSLDKGI